MGARGYELRDFLNRQPTPGQAALVRAVFERNVCDHVVDVHVIAWIEIFTDRGRNRDVRMANPGVSAAEAWAGLVDVVITGIVAGNSKVVLETKSYSLHDLLFVFEP
jgi:hypothetical protein